LLAANVAILLAAVGLAGARGRAAGSPRP
jgi:hypothetical protein